MWLLILWRLTCINLYELCNPCDLIVRLQIKRHSFDNERVLCQHMCTYVWSVIIIVNCNKHLSILYKMFLPTNTISMTYLCPLTSFRQVQGLPVGTVCWDEGSRPRLWSAGGHVPSRGAPVRGSQWGKAVSNCCLTFLMSQRQADMYTCWSELWLPF